jgi:hypothetical protein
LQNRACNPRLPNPNYVLHNLAKNIEHLAALRRQTMTHVPATATAETAYWINPSMAHSNAQTAPQCCEPLATNHRIIDASPLKAILCLRARLIQLIVGLFIGLRYV